MCFVLCIKNFPFTTPLALSLTVSFNGLTAALYNLAVKSLNPSSSAVYLLLNALLPLFTSLVALFPVLQQPSLNPMDSDAVKREKSTFLKLNTLAFVTGLYLLFLHPSDSFTARFLLSGAVFLMIFPLGIPGIFYDREWFGETISSSFNLLDSDDRVDNDDDDDDLELHKQLLLSDEISFKNRVEEGKSFGTVNPKDELVMLGEEHEVGMLVRRVEFWLYYVAYFCGGTLGLVYSNNLGQISESLGHSSMTSKLIAIYASFSFFGRLLSAVPDFIRT